MSTPNEEPTEGGNPLLDSLYASIESQPAPAADAPTRGRTMHEALAAPEKPAEPKPEEKAKPETKPEGSAPVVEKEAKEPARRVKVRRAQEAAPAPAAPPPAQAPAPAKEEPKEDDESGLLDEEKDKLRVARYAARKNPAKYGDQDKKLVTYFRKHAEFITKKQAEDPDYDFTDDNPEYKAFQSANRPPAIPAFEERALEREMIKDEAVAAADERIAADRESRRLEDLKPQIKRRADQFWKEVVATALPDELASAIKTHGAAKAREMHPLEYEVSDTVTKGAADAMQEFLEIAGGVKRFDGKNPQHIGIATFIDDECKNFAAAGKDTIRDGKKFIARSDFHSMSVQQRAAYWTFSNDEIVARARFATRFSIQQMIKAETDKRAAQGWARPAAPAAAKPQEPTPSSSTRPAPAAGSAPDAGGSTGGNIAMSLLGY